MKTCKGCRNSVPFFGSDLVPDGRRYCIASPEHDTPEELKHLIKPERIVQSGEWTNYIVEPEDECVVSSMREY